MSNENNQFENQNEEQPVNNSTGNDNNMNHESFRQSAENIKKEASNMMGHIAESAKKDGGSFFSGFLNFDSMIASKIIKIIYVIALIFTIVGALGTILSGLFTLFSWPGVGFAKIIAGLVSLIIGPLLVRVWAEMLIVLFNINDNLAEIKKELKK